MAATYYYSRGARFAPGSEVTLHLRRGDWWDSDTAANPIALAVADSEGIVRFEGPLSDLQGERVRPGAPLWVVGQDAGLQSQRFAVHAKDFWLR